jgi:hypothetical protein
MATAKAMWMPGKKSPASLQLVIQMPPAIEPHEKKQGTHKIVRNQVTSLETTGAG